MGFPLNILDEVDRTGGSPWSGLDAVAFIITPLSPSLLPCFDCCLPNPCPWPPSPTSFPSSSPRLCRVSSKTVGYLLGQFTSPCDCIGADIRLSTQLTERGVILVVSHSNHTRSAVRALVNAEQRNIPTQIVLLLPLLRSSARGSGVISRRFSLAAP
jgi:hypothetical protein